MDNPKVYPWGEGWGGGGGVIGMYSQLLMGSVLLWSLGQGSSSGPRP